jgi:methyl-accepting chemotaxis protein
MIVQRLRDLSITKKLAAIPVVLMVGITGILVYTLQTMSALETSSVLVNVAGRQRMLNQRHLREAVARAGGTDVDMEATRGLLANTVTTMIAGGDVPLGGGAFASVPPALTPEILDKLEEQREELQVFEQGVDAYLATQGAIHALEDEVPELLARSAAVDEAADRAVGLLERFVVGDETPVETEATEAEREAAEIAEALNVATAINLAGRQRMLNQRYVKEVLFVSQGGEADVATTRRWLTETLQALTKGGSAPLPSGSVDLRPVSDPAIQEAFRQQQSHLEGAFALGDRILDISGLAAQAAAQLEQLRAGNGALHVTVNDAVTLMGAAAGPVKRVMLIEMILGFAVCLIGGLWTFVMARQLLGPLAQTQRALTQLADGDLTGQVSVQSDDEIGQMGTALNLAIRSTREIADGISANAMQLGTSVEELDAVSQSMAGGAEQTSNQSAMVAAAAEEVSANVQTVSAASEEMGASISEIARNTTEATRIAGDAVNVAERANGMVGRLSSSSEEIGQVVQVINSIAQQTNLLALNATIESARAGEAGKGFAVVANEVKELAGETSKATEEIGRQIEAIQADTTAAVQAISEISDIIGRIHEMQGTVAAAIEEQGATSAEITRNVSEAARGSGEIAGNITEVAKVAEGTSSGVSQIRTAASEMGQMATSLQQVVARFRIAGPASDVPRAEEPTTLDVPVAVPAT